MKYAVSACLLGENCKYSGGNNYREELVRYLKDHEVIPICPEVAGGMPIPRTPFELVGGVAIDKNGNNVHPSVMAGVTACVEKLKKENVACVILQPRSPSCGVGRIYDGTFRGVLTAGNGLFAEELIKNGFCVMSADDFPVK